MEAFRPLRRHKQLLSNEETIAILQRGTHGVLAVAGDNGYPYAVPLSYVYAHGTLYFHSATEGHKVEAMRREKRVSFCVVDSDDVKPAEYTTFFRSAIAFGKITLLESNDEKIEALRMLGNRYHPGHDADAMREVNKSLNHVLVIRMDIDYLTGKQAIELVK
ncbi:MAG: pyridoxamine 5'-phosphate oxidase family protein [Bacteroidales bacterium]|nr:pyridoxamine 5'-phosphate oxidase family protein [Bacteroidales bacterium]